MAVIFSSIYGDLGVLLTIAVWTVYWYFNRNFDYWKIRRIAYIKPQAFFGNIKDMVFFRKAQHLVFQDLYKELDGHKYGGIFMMMNPTLLLRDPEIIKTVLVKDFPYFQDRGFNVDMTENPLAQHLFVIGGWKWRALRMKLSPTFTSGKMKMMFQVIEECSKRLQDYLAKPAEKGDILELKEVLAKFSTDVIGTCAFGLQMNALENPDSEFRKWGRRALQPKLSTALRGFFGTFLPEFARFFHIKIIEPEVNDFFLNVVKETVDYRLKHNIKRNDFLQLLIELKDKGQLETEEEDHDANNNDKLEGRKDMKPEERHLEMDDGLLAAQAFVFFLAGFETSSTTMSFALHELAVNPDVQTKLREEVDDTLEETGGKFTYDAIMNMKYMDKVVSETLRKFPPVGILMRDVTVPYTLPDERGKLDVGTRIVIPVYGLHHDHKYFPNPDIFDPERFSDEMKARRPHYVYMPFGEGPRNCIGMRFGLLQTKMGLAALIAKYEFHVCERTELPIEFDPKAPVTASHTGTILRVTNRSYTQA